MDMPNLLSIDSQTVKIVQFIEEETGVDGNNSQQLAGTDFLREALPVVFSQNCKNLKYQFTCQGSTVNTRGLKGNPPSGELAQQLNQMVRTPAQPKETGNQDRILQF